MAEHQTALARVCCGVLSVLRLEADGLYLLSQARGIKKKKLKGRGMQGNVFPLLQSPDRLKPVQDVARAAPTSSHHGFFFNQ